MKQIDCLITLLVVATLLAITTLVITVLLVITALLLVVTALRLVVASLVVAALGLLVVANGLLVASAGGDALARLVNSLGSGGVVAGVDVDSLSLSGRTASAEGGDGRLAAGALLDGAQALGGSLGSSHGSLGGEIVGDGGRLGGGDVEGAVDLTLRDSEGRDVQVAAADGALEARLVVGLVASLDGLQRVAGLVADSALRHCQKLIREKVIKSKYFEE